MKLQITDTETGKTTTHDLPYAHILVAGRGSEYFDDEFPENVRMVITSYEVVVGGDDVEELYAIHDGQTVQLLDDESPGE